MKICFKKGWNPAKPKRWYVFPVPNSGQPKFVFNSDIYAYNHLTALTVKSWTASYAIRKEIRDVVGISGNICLHFGACGVSDWEHIFLYFRSHADEAEFMLKISNEEIEI